MKAWKIYTLIILILVSIGTKFILFDYKVSSGKRVGNLTKISKKGRFLKTWEGTLDEGSGDKLTSYFSVYDDSLGKELYAYEGRQVILYYEEHFMGWPHDTNYNVTSWRAKEDDNTKQSGSTQVQNIRSGGDAFVKALIKNYGGLLFCSFLGTLHKDPKLYIRVKKFIQKENLFLFKMYETCNKWMTATEVLENKSNLKDNL